MTKPLKIVFMGTPDFAVPCLEALLQRSDLAQVLAVYTQPDKVAGRSSKPMPSAVKICAVQYGLPTHQPENINQNLETLQTLQPDLIIVVAYAQFLGSKILALPRFGCFNVHASLLPKYRGASPIQSALLDGETKTGTSVIRLVKKMDAGPIVHQEHLTIDPEDNSETLFQKLSQQGASCLTKVLEAIKTGTLSEQIQDEAQATYTKKITKEDGRINWKQTASLILNQLRAYYPWPGSYTLLDNKQVLKIHQARLASEPDFALASTPPPGSIFRTSNQIFVRCSDAWLEITSLQLEGKKIQNSKDFCNGYKKELLLEK